MKSITTILALTILTLGHFSTAQEIDDGAYASNKKKENLNHGFGVAATTTMGRGLSYRFQPDKLGAQITGLPTLRVGGELNVFLGASVMYQFIAYDKLDMFTYLGSEIIYQRFNSGYPSNPTTTRLHKINSSIGSGINLYLGTYFNLSMNIGYGLYRWNSSSETNVTFSNIDAGIGLYFKF